MTLGLIFGLILIQLIAVGWIDYRTEKISNNWVVLNIVVSVLLHVFLGNLYPLSWEVLIFPLGFIIIGFLLFLMHIMGAGDSKYLASLFLIIPLEYQILFFEKLVLSTIFTGSILLLYKIITHREKLKAYFISRYWGGIKQTIQSRFSYAPVVTVAWILLGFNIWA